MDKIYDESEIGLDKNNVHVLWHLKIPGVSNNTTEIPELKKTISWTSNDQATDKTCFK